MVNTSNQPDTISTATSSGNDKQRDIFLSEVWLGKFWLKIFEILYPSNVVKNAGAYCERTG
jgi:hypothetical protein